MKDELIQPLGLHFHRRHGLKSLPLPGCEAQTIGPFALQSPKLHRVSIDAPAAVRPDDPFVVQLPKLQLVSRAPDHAANGRRAPRFAVGRHARLAGER